WDLSLADESAPRQPDAQQLAGWWNDLASDEADRAYRAMRALATVPRQATSFFSERLRPVAAVEPRALAKLIADLDSRQFAVRQQAAEELEVLGSQAVPALQEVLKGEPSLEVRQRVEELLDEADRLILSGRALRTWRAIEVLEHLGTPEARQLLTNLGKGTPDSRLTREAQAALARCKRR
ncbi:MAG: hypothetical protein JNM56_05900, partial [Planctomycetia bacterium]|nr:hypothetical protein [Planctomycetia bacterium]